MTAKEAMLLSFEHSSRRWMRDELYNVYGAIEKAAADGGFVCFYEGELTGAVKWILVEDKFHVYFNDAKRTQISWHMIWNI